MIIKTYGGCISGIQAELVTVEVQIQRGLPRFSIVGLGDSAVQESRERVLAAIGSLRVKVDVELPDQILVNLSPADLRKVGSSLDLPIAAAIVASMGLIDPNLVNNSLFFGELSLAGDIKSVRGAIAYAVLAKQKGITRLICPESSIKEVSLIDQLKIVGLSKLVDLFDFTVIEKSTTSTFVNIEKTKPVDPFESIVGQSQAKRAMVIAAAGGHHLLMVGPPGCGKTMMAQAMTNLIPSLCESERLDLVSIHSVAGCDISNLLEAVPPFRSPHYNISQAGLIGGGSKIKPGEITLAHKGILFLDEFPEFSRSAIESLRLPLESGEVVISRAVGSHRFPAKFQLVVAMNPCPCGLFGYSEKCKCSAVEIDKYQKKISAAILDRIDLHVGMQPIEASDLFNQKTLKSTNDYNQEINRVRKESLKRFDSICAEINPQKIYSSIPMNFQAKNFLIHTAGKFHLSARAINKLIKVATTISMLNCHDSIEPEDIAEALSFRIRVGNDNSNQTVTYASEI